MCAIILVLLVWIYCLGRAGVWGNEQGYRLALTEPVMGTITMDKRHKNEIVKKI